MARLGLVFVSGVVWTIIAIGVGILGSWLTTLTGIWPFLGWPVAIIGFGFAGMSALRLWQITKIQKQEVPMFQSVSDGIARAMRQYKDAIRQGTNDTHELMIELLKGVIEPVQQDAARPIQNGVQYIRDVDSQGRFMMLRLHVSLASILFQLDRGPRSDLSTPFKDLVLSLWDRPPTMTVESLHKLFEYSQQQLGDTLVTPSDDELEDVGLTLLSIAVPHQEQFSAGAASACGQAAHACWHHASLITQRVMES